MSAIQKISQKTAINPYRFQKGESNPRFGKPRVAGSGTPAQVLEFFDKEKNETTIYPSIRAAARAIDCKDTSIRNYFSFTK